MKRLQRRNGACRFHSRTDFKRLPLIAAAAATTLCQFPSVSVSALLLMGMLPRQRLKHLAIWDHLVEASKRQLH